MKQLVVCLVFLLGFSSCSLVKLKKDLEESERTAPIVGRVESRFTSTSPIVVAIFKDDPKGKILLDYRVLAGPGIFGFLVPLGNYDLVSYQDFNSSGKYEVGEPAFMTYIERPTSEKRDLVIFQLDDGFRPTEKQRMEFANAIWEIERTFPLSFGEVANFSDPIFSSDFGVKGFWEPLRFAKEAGMGIYFLEEYSQEKTPVLFVSGAFGYPLGWKALMEAVDKEKYQACFFLYPSGNRIESNAEVLAGVLKEVHTIYGFKKINMVAHSMGGLVGYRSIQITREKQYGNYVNLFISISTPWDGHHLAAKGVKHSPVVVPCWIDIDPGSEFIKRLFDVNIPCDHHLWFSYAGSSISISENSDGTVSLRSQLRSDAQEKARRVFGFNEDHNSILESEDVVNYLNRTMGEYE